MKKLINQIERLICIIIITLMCYFRICKNLILLGRHKISILEFMLNMCNILDDAFFKAYYCGLIDADKEFSIMDEIIEIKIKLEMLKA